MTRWKAALPLALTLCVTLGLASLLAGCSSNKRRAAARNASAHNTAAQNARRGTSPTGARSPARTTDTGSRYIHPAGPVGGIAVETSPIAGGALLLPYASPQQLREPAWSQDEVPEVLPAPALPPREHVPPQPPPPPAWQ